MRSLSLVAMDAACTGQGTRRGILSAGVPPLVQVQQGGGQVQQWQSRVADKFTQKVTPSTKYERVKVGDEHDDVGSAAGAFTIDEDGTEEISMCAACQHASVSSARLTSK